MPNYFIGQIWEQTRQVCVYFLLVVSGKYHELFLNIKRLTLWLNKCLDKVFVARCHDFINSW